MVKVFGEVIAVDDALLLVGLGSREDLDAGTLRTLGARLVKFLDRSRLQRVRLRIAEVVDGRRLNDDAVGRALGEGIGLANWRVDFWDGTATKHAKPLTGLTLDANAGAKRGLKLGLEMATWANETRRLAAAPPNVANPQWVANEARRLARRVGLKVKVITTAEARRLGMGGLVAVGQGAKHGARLVVLEHAPPRKKKGVKLALVGKTMTYDSGGYSLKPSAGMKGMKYDGNGGYAVLGAMLAIAARKLPVHVFGLLPIAENMVSAEAYRPDDIIEMYNGVKVEVTNTDAEGRLILGDALAYASKTIKPTAMIDVATLTGGIVVALGSWCAGMFCRDEDLAKRIEEAARETDERVWPMPLWEEHRDFMRAQHADIWNSAPKRDGHPIQGAAFLSYFADEKIPWAHLDIAGTSATDAPTDLFVQGPTGFGVRLLTETVAGLA